MVHALEPVGFTGLGLTADQLSNFYYIVCYKIRLFKLWHLAFFFELRLTIFNIVLKLFNLLVKN
jgi:hypothetical protein